MDPSKIKLTKTQKIKPLLRAINKEIPWQVVLLFIVSISIAVYITGLIPLGAFFTTFIGLDFFMRRIFVGAIVMIVSFVTIALIAIGIVEKIVPLFKKISKNFSEEEAITKKEVLDSVIDEEILLK